MRAVLKMVAGCSVAAGLGPSLAVALRKRGRVSRSRSDRSRRSRGGHSSEFRFLGMLHRMTLGYSAVVPWPPLSTPASAGSPPSVTGGG